MGGLFGGGGGSPAPAPTPVTVAPTPTVTSPTDPLVVGPYPDDGAMRMPVSNSPNSIAAARKKRDRIVTRSGRESTRLVSDTGTRSYTNSFLGSVQ